jgi:hypothetical protein
MGSNRIHVLAVLLLFLSFLAQCLGSLTHKSPTFDEVLYLPAGYSFIRTGTVLTNPEAQPLPRILTALGLMSLKLNFDPQEIPPFKARFQWSADFLFQKNGAQAETIVFCGRLPMIALGTLMLLVLYLWARELFGAPASLVALAFAALEPNLIAYSSLATADLPVTAFFLFTLFSFWRWLRNQGSLRFLLLTGCLLGAAFLCKTTALFLIPVLFLVWGLDQWIRKEFSAVRFVRDAGRLFLILLVALFFVNAVFLFQGSFTDKAEIINLTGAQAQAGFLRILVFALPDSVAFPLLYNAAESAGRFHPFPFFLNGSCSYDGFWYYFLEAILIKTPLPLLIWSVFSIAMLLRHASARVAMILTVPWLPLLLYFSFFNKLNLGLRHVLPLYPFLCIIAAAPIAYGKRIPGRLLYGCVALLLCWNLWGAIRIFPHHLAYFNELVGGPSNGYRYLVDSNLDWGQDLINLKPAMNAMGIDRIHLSYFGNADPLHYGISYDYLPSPRFEPWTMRHSQTPLRLEKGFYAISATNLQGVYLPDRNTYAVFRNRKPLASVGYSILIYSYP